MLHIIFHWLFRHTHSYSHLVFCTWIYVMHRIWPAFLVISLPSKPSSQGIQVIEGIMKREKKERDDNKKTVCTHDNFFLLLHFHYTMECINMPLHMLR